MATISITIPDAQVPRVLAAFSARRLLQGSAEPADAAYVRGELVAFVKGITLDMERTQAAKDAVELVTPIDVT